MDTKRLGDWLVSAEGLRKSLLGLLLGLFSIWVGVTEAFDKVAQSNKWLPAWTPSAVAVLVITGYLLILIRSARRFIRASQLEQPDAFTLHPTGPATLIGRADDTTRLLKFVKHSRLVLLDGESGCGKSALISAGLLPELQASNGLLPVAIRDWGDDWVRGPLSAALDALFHSLSSTERERLDWTAAPDLTADTPSLAADLKARLKAVVDSLGRRPLLIADQFDDYQARHRSCFLDNESSWLSPAALARANPFWKLVNIGLGGGHLHLLIVTRSDMAAGLTCVRFLAEDQSINHTLERIANEYLHSLLTGIAPEDAQPPVVSHPEGGWQELRELLERDLKAEGAVLMQQVRTVLLGLRQLPLLTPRHYRAAGGLRGVETLVVSRAVSQAGDAAGGGEAGRPIVRALLSKLILSGGPNQAPKARRASLSVLTDIAGEQHRAEAILGALQRNEVVRPADTVGGEIAWQLDHDYLARAVLAEARHANRWTMALREGKARYEEAAGNWRQRWAALLPVATLMRVFWERGRGRLWFGGATSFVWASAIRPGVAVLGLTVIGATAYELNQDRLLTVEANGIIDQFGSAAANDAVIRIWRAPELLRRRVYKLILTGAEKGNSRLERATSTQWPLAHAGLEPACALEAAAALRLRLEQEKDGEIAKSFAQAYTAVAARLSEPADLKAEAAALRLRLDGPGGLNTRYVRPYAAVAARLSEPADLKAAAAALRLRLQQEKSSLAASNLVQAYAAVAGAMLQHTAAKEGLNEAQSQERRKLVIEVLTMAGHPFVKDLGPLFAALGAAAGVDFPDQQITNVVRWATQTYGIQASQLRPQPLSR
jgi:hypothetical protein